MADQKGSQTSLGVLALHLPYLQHVGCCRTQWLHVIEREPLSFLRMSVILFFRHTKVKTRWIGRILTVCESKCISRSLFGTSTPILQMLIIYEYYNQPISPSSWQPHIRNDREDAGSEGSCCLSAITKYQVIYSNVYSNFSTRTPLEVTSFLKSPVPRWGAGHQRGEARSVP